MSKMNHERKRHYTSDYTSFGSGGYGGFYKDPLDADNDFTTNHHIYKKNAEIGSKAEYKLTWCLEKFFPEGKLMEGHVYMHRDKSTKPKMPHRIYRTGDLPIPDIAVVLPDKVFWFDSKRKRTKSWTIDNKIHDYRTFSEYYGPVFLAFSHEKIDPAFDIIDVSKEWAWEGYNSKGEWFCRYNEKQCERIQFDQVATEENT